MPLDRTRSRPDIAFLRRRPHKPAPPPAPPAAPPEPAAPPPPAAKPARTSLRPPSAAKPARTSLRPPSAPPATPAPAPSGGGLSLKRPDPTPPPKLKPPGPPKRATRDAPRAHGRTLLGPENPTVTLDRRQAGIGLLTIEMITPGWPISLVWELVDGTAGIVSASTNVVAGPEFEGMPIVELRNGQLLVTLRRVRQLRRLLVVVHDPERGGPPGTVVLSLYDHTTIESLHDGAEPTVVAMALYQVDGELVIRREDSSWADLGKATEAYGFQPTWRPPVR